MDIELAAAKPTDFASGNSKRNDRPRGKDRQIFLSFADLLSDDVRGSSRLFGFYEARQLFPKIDACESTLNVMITSERGDRLEFVLVQKPSCHDSPSHVATAFLTERKNPLGRPPEPGEEPVVGRKTTNRKGPSPAFPPRGFLSIVYSQPTLRSKLSHENSSMSIAKITDRTRRFKTTSSSACGASSPFGFQNAYMASKG